MVSIPACHAGDRGSIPRRGGYFANKNTWRNNEIHLKSFYYTFICLICQSFCRPLWQCNIQELVFIRVRLNACLKLTGHFHLIRFCLRVFFIQVDNMRSNLSFIVRIQKSDTLFTLQLLVYTPYTSPDKSPDTDVIIFTVLSNSSSLIKCPSLSDSSLS